MKKQNDPEAALRGAGARVETFTPPPTLIDASEIARLAAMPPLEYDRERSATAERLGVRVGTLDQEVQSVRPKPDASTGRILSLAEVEPWPEAVVGEELLNRLVTNIRQHVVLSPAAADCVALWIAHTWVHTHFQHSPRLSITSPAKRCGKSTLLDMLRVTCMKPLKADNISAAGVYRTVEAMRPMSLLIDEADSFLRENEQLRGIINSGFEQSGEVVRVVEVQGDFQPVRFATFCPVALAGIGALPSTLEDRAVPVVLQRKSADVPVTKLRAPGARVELANTARWLARWAADRARYLTQDPPIPDAMGDREGDISVPLLSIADDAGGVWPNRARKALLEVFGRRTATEDNTEPGVMLLGDIRKIFTEHGAARLPSSEIVKLLAEMDERPWPEWRQGRPITAPQLARVLAPFKVRPRIYRPPAGAPVKGYFREHFEEAWNCYLVAHAAESGLVNR
jgi:putative DNA primase/helicase